MNQLIRKILCSIVCLLMSAVSIAVYGIGALNLVSITSANTVNDHGMLISWGSGLVAVAAAIQWFLYKRCNVIGLFIHKKIIWLFFVLPFSLIVAVAVWAAININTETGENGYRSPSSSHYSFD